MTDRITQRMMNQHAALRPAERHRRSSRRPQQQLSSGKELTEPSDDPYGASRRCSYAPTWRRTSSTSATSPRRTRWQNVTDTALGDDRRLVLRARDLVVQGANDTTTPSDRAARSPPRSTSSIDSIKTDGNTQYAGRYIFSGTTTHTQPYQLGADDAYAGNTAIDHARDRPGRPGRRQPCPARASSATARPACSRRSATIVDRSARPATRPRSARPTCRRSTPPTTRSLNARASRRRPLEPARHARRTGCSSSRSRRRSSSPTPRTPTWRRRMIDFSTQQAVYQAALKRRRQIIQPSLMDFLSTSDSEGGQPCRSKAPGSARSRSATTRSSRSRTG